MEAVAPAAPRPFAVFESKLRIPALRPGIVSRAGLVNRLRAERAVRLATLVAPAGYGKTTLLAQWAARDERPFAWLSVDTRDNDPLVLLRHLATAFDSIEPLDSSVLDTLARPDASVWTDASPRLAAAIASCGTPFVAVLDGADALDGDAADVVAALADAVPDGSMLALAGRTAPALPIARLRAAARLLELGTEELALSRRESLLLVRAAGLDLDDDDASELVARAEGWAAGLYLATLALDELGPPYDVADVSGADSYLVDYFWSECLSQFAPERLAFLRRTSVLERLSAELCDALLERDDSASELTAVRRAGLFLVPLDRHEGWYRYHRLFRDVLAHELVQHESAQIPGLHRRAADWFEARDDGESALRHAQATGDAPRAARILTTIALPGSGTPIETVGAWLERFDRAASLDAHPAVAALGTLVQAQRGRPAEAERWLAAAEGGRRRVRGVLPDGSRSARPWVALARAATCAEGVERMAKDVADALVGLPAGSPWRPTALVLQGVARALGGDPEAADASFVAAAEAADRTGDAHVRVVAIAQRWLLAAAAGDFPAADRLALEAGELAMAGTADERGGYALARAAAARTCLRHGRWDDARHELAAAERLAGSLTEALPWLAVQSRAALGAACLTLRDREGAGAQLAECARMLALRPDLGTLTRDVEELRRQLDELPAARDGHGAGLTGAELRLLPLLATHLSFREIGERLYVSRNTIKTQAISVYRKLGVSSRSAAIARAAELGLVDAVAADFTRRG
ncbi:MAG TPA: LuxR C-terminal-related transcriptional regulator [Gaiellaceae bacterium]|nr:LuxR C-terminal-related transcriptional regulator [Gaiellaceae bacterium]